jgi:hypothetical protein
MNTVIGADAAKLAGLQIDLLQKIRNGQVTPDHLEWFNKLTREERERFCNGAHAISVSSTIAIDRTQPFDPAKLLGQGWTVEEQDERSVILGQINLADVRLEHMLKKDESLIKGEEKLKRLKKAEYIRLDAKVFQTLWENQTLIPESWKTNSYTTFVIFDGTILCGPDGDRCVLYLCWRGGRWDWGCDWFENDWDVSSPSAVLASI